MKQLEVLLKPLEINVEPEQHGLLFSGNGRELKVVPQMNDAVQDQQALTIPFDVMVREPLKLCSVVQSRLGLNKVIFGRKTLVKKIPKTEAEEFFNRYHLMGATGSAYNYGLFLNEELVAAASFSKGRKMNRLPDDKRSFELIRFCNKSGITVSGGLSKLLNYFIKEKNPGDIMTYVDKQFAEGRSFLNLGFRKVGETGPLHFLVEKKTLVRLPLNELQSFDKSRYHHVKTAGNLKLVLVPA